MSCHYQCEDDCHGLAVIEVEIQPADQGVAQNHWGYAWREGMLIVAGRLWYYDHAGLRQLIVPAQCNDHRYGHYKNQ